MTDASPPVACCRSGAGCGPASGWLPGPAAAGQRFALLLAALAGLALCGRFEAGRFVYGLCFAASFMALAWAVRGVPAGRPRGRTTVAILLLAVVVRLLFLWAWPADSDVFRYIAEGALQGSGGNPYRLAPGDAAVPTLLSEATRQFLGRVNHPELSAAYPPLAQLFCWFTAAVSPSPTAFQTAALLADLAACLLLARLLAARRLPSVWLAFYALNPLVLAMGVGEGHLDALVALAVVLALASFDVRRDGWGFFWLGAAGMVKYPALLLIPFFFRSGNLSRAAWSLVPLACFWPYREAGWEVFRSLTVFAGHISHGGPLVAVLQPVLGGAAPIASLAVGGAVLAVGWLAIQDPVRGGLWAMLTVLACLPTVYPWYFLAVVPFWLLRPGWPVLWLLAAQGAVTAPTWLRGVALGGEGVLLAVAWLPFFVLLACSLRRPAFVAPLAVFGPVRRLSVIVPARNEAAVIARCLGSLAATGLADVVVADGGSTDATAALARELGATVVVAGGGRGGQIAAGLAACRGDAVLVLHADAVLAPDGPARIVWSLNRYPQAAGGVVGMRFDAPGWRLGLLTRLNALRASGMGIGFGDQGQFFRREALAAAGGFPDMALMEDVELALRLRSVGETLSLGGGITVSGRRWAGAGFGGKAAGVVRLFLAYLAGRRLGLADPTGRRYFCRYYGRPPHHTAV